MLVPLGLVAPAVAADGGAKWWGLKNGHWRIVEQCATCERQNKDTWYIYLVEQRGGSSNADAVVECSLVPQGMTRTSIRAGQYMAGNKWQYMLYLAWVSERAHAHWTSQVPDCMWIVMLDHGCHWCQELSQQPEPVKDNHAPM